MIGKILVNGKTSLQKVRRKMVAALVKTSQGLPGVQVLQMERTKKEILTYAN